MTSDKVKNAIRMISAARAGGVSLNGGLLKALQHQLTDIRDQVMALEAAQVPTALRVTADHIASGKVVPLTFERSLQ